ncbi:hypothetical protein E3P81_03437 [Wallemia ichthyophaga]|nr:hypothetical protein E3P97_03474 [Wallemia ichthyophaga]TIB28900.1 hypothetical protein E3P85_03431 [Wallemia ichthyophaga]TIB44548.1 hypothetical protein E3P82_03442 [Wallemia ichthyophaga]TIB47005.1 hypothetical protein E3P81_03437 [Wallemia ichthyophaga]TIB50034.1 hypothetical protein E3P80_03446 [Wallemia ichthyophaga]
MDSNRIQVRPSVQNVSLRNRTVSANSPGDKPFNPARRAFRPRRSEPLRSSRDKENTPTKQANTPTKQAYTPTKQATTPNKPIRQLPVTPTPVAASTVPPSAPSQTPHQTPTQTPKKTTDDSSTTPVYSPVAASERTTRSPVQQSPSHQPSHQPSSQDELMTEHTLAPFSVADSGWELETASNDCNALDEDFQNTVNLLSTQHSSTILSYKRLLESCQNSSAAQLYALQAEVNELHKTTHALRVENRNMKLDRDNIPQSTPPTHLSTLLYPHFDEIAVQKALRQLNQGERLRLMRVILENTLPHDITTTIAMLEKYAASAFDLLATLPTGISVRILSHLSVSEALGCRLVSKRWSDMVSKPALWRAFSLRLTASDPDPLSPPDREDDWQPLYRALHFREQNWRRGAAQSIKLLRGHTGYVTSMQLKQGVLVTGSYDQTLRIWDVGSGECRTVLQAKAISCLDYLPKHKVLAAGYFDVGRVVVYSTLTNQQLQMLQGHNKGIRAVACNDEYLVSAGQDKALVVWNWRTGQRIARFGQQTNVSIGVQLIDSDKFIAVTVDSIVRCFSITKREMTSQYRLSSLLPELSSIGNSDTSLTWFGADGLSMTCATKNHLIHLEWEEGEEEVILGEPIQTQVQHVQQTQAQTQIQTQSQQSQLAPHTHTSGTLKPRSSTVSIGASNTPNATNGRGPRRSLGIGGAHAQSPLLPRKNSADESISDANSVPSNPSHPSLGSTAANPYSYSNFPSHSSPTSPTPQIRRRKAPILTNPPRVVQITHTQNMAPVGATDVSKHRVVTSTRFSSRSGADRRLFCSTLGDTVPIEGVWKDLSPRCEDVGVEMAKDSLANSNRGPLSICIDHQQAVFGCADGTVYSLSFVGENYTSHTSSPPS